MIEGQSALIVEADDPRPQQDAGSVAIEDLRWGLSELGYETRLVTETRPKDLTDALAKYFDLVFLSRPSTFLRNYPLVRRGNNRVVYFAHDLHYLRLSLGQALGEKMSSIAPTVMKSVEGFCFISADMVLLPTDGEVAIVSEQWPSAIARRMNYFAMDTSDVKKSFLSSHGLVFIGSRDHAPNRDGLAWFLSEVWPIILAELPEITFTVIGDWQGQFGHCKNVTFLGRVSATDAANAMSVARVGIAPLRYGAGLKRKTLHYLAAGLPVVTTNFGLQGLEDAVSIKPAAVIAHDPREWASRVLEVHSREDLWTEVSQNALRYVATRFSRSSYLRDLSAAVGHAVP